MKNKNRKSSPVGIPNRDLVDDNGILHLSLADKIYALRWELSELGANRKPELWRALDVASTDLKAGDVQQAASLVAFVNREVGRLGVIAKPTMARQYRKSIIERRVLREWQKVRDKNISRNSFAINFARNRKLKISRRSILGIISRAEGKSTLHPGRPRQK